MHLAEDTKKDSAKKPFDPTVAFYADEISSIWKKQHSEKPEKKGEEGPKN